MADGWLCTCEWFDCADWEASTVVWCLATCFLCGFPIVPLCTKYFQSTTINHDSSLKYQIIILKNFLKIYFFYQKEKIIPLNICEKIYKSKSYK